MERISTTAHARERMQQRAISELQVQLIEYFGVHRLQKGGSNLSYIPQKTLTELRRAIDKMADMAVVFGEGERVLTAMYKTRNIHTTDYAA